MKLRAPLRSSDAMTLAGLQNGICRGLIVPSGRSMGAHSWAPGVLSVASVGLMTSQGDVAISAESIDFGPKFELFRLRIRPMAESPFAMALAAEWPSDTLRARILGKALTFGVATRSGKAQVEPQPNEIHEVDIEEDWLIAVSTAAAGISFVIALDDRIPLNVIVSSDVDAIRSLTRGLDMRFV